MLTLIDLPPSQGFLFASSGEYAFRDVASFSRCPSSRARDNLHILSTANDRVVLKVAGAEIDSAVSGVDKSRGVLAALAKGIGVRRALTGYDEATGAMLHSSARGFNAHAILCSFKLFGLNCELPSLTDVPFDSVLTSSGDHATLSARPDEPAVFLQGVGAFHAPRNKPEDIGQLSPRP